jgi:hypothetical protein
MTEGIITPEEVGSSAGELIDFLMMPKQEYGREKVNINPGY